MSAYKSAKILKDTEEIIKQLQEYLMKKDGVYYAQSRLIHLGVQALIQKIDLKNKINQDKQK